MRRLSIFGMYCEFRSRDRASPGFEKHTYPYPLDKDAKVDKRMVVMVPVTGQGIWSDLLVD